jgi:hypothetical protein
MTSDRNDRVPSRGTQASADHLDSSLRNGSFRLHEFLPFRMDIHIGCSRRRGGLRIPESANFLTKLWCRQLPCGAKTRKAHVSADASAIAVKSGFIQRTGLVLQE